MGNYDDIMNRTRPVSGRRTHMANADRAKQFCPFAALKGYEEALRLKQVKYEKRIELTDDAKTILDRKLHILAKRLKDGLETAVTVRYFVPKIKPEAPETPLGSYMEITGRAEKIKAEARTLQISGKSLFMDDIVDIREAPDGVFEPADHSFCDPCD
ncbi:hypothetical protein [Eubacterium sp. 1001713B170207_170306_E7]|uniref:hypothetical protein n=1 Tax=Eubacterium sp. 1001713B170207_170306_E7 TaxID=2787097 RepID=UPI0018972F78|nr:hypothetical protein [Eubacterium sp. 1001713B170207_170306_E7]